MIVTYLYLKENYKNQQWIHIKLELIIIVVLYFFQQIRNKKTRNQLVTFFILVVLFEINLLIFL